MFCNTQIINALKSLLIKLAFFHSNPDRVLNGESVDMRQYLQDLVNNDPVFFGEIADT